MKDDALCRHCGDTPIRHHEEDHPGLCCDCFDLECGKDLDKLNAERARQGKLPVGPFKR